jgi:hypothetical protein
MQITENLFEILTSAIIVYTVVGVGVATIALVVGIKIRRRKR